VIYFQAPCYLVKDFYEIHLCALVVQKRGIFASHDVRPETTLFPRSSPSQSPPRIPPPATPDKWPRIILADHFYVVQGCNRQNVSGNLFGSLFKETLTFFIDYIGVERGSLVGKVFVETIFWGGSVAPTSDETETQIDALRLKSGIMLQQQSSAMLCCKCR